MLFGHINKRLLKLRSTSSGVNVTSARIMRGVKLERQQTNGSRQQRHWLLRLRQASLARVGSAGRKSSGRVSLEWAERLVPKRLRSCSRIKQR